ncbi:MAG: SLC13 family permease [Alphaproteobacteria bacterium]|nr:SLC13 family permease [Alphaproteobacteria bacterium]
MTTPQIMAFGIILASLILFAWGSWRYDVVAMGALVVAVICGIVPSETAFSGFSDPAVITVAAVLIISQSLQRSGAINVLASAIGKLPSNPTIQIGALTLTVAILSAFMNNVGALALMLPVAIRAAQASNMPPSRVLMPIAFGSLLGGLTTLIGTPPNIIISSYRAEVMGKSFGEGGGFGMFDFAPVGALAALVGVIFIITIGYRLIPHREGGDTALEDLMKIDEYVTELAVPEGSPLIGKPIRELVVLADGDVSVVALIRQGEKELAPPWYTRMMPGDHLMIEGGTEAIAMAVEKSGFDLVTDRDISTESLSSDEVIVIEAVVNPGSRLEGRTAGGLRINSRYGVNILAVARQGKPIRDRIGHIRFQAGDVVLIQGAEQLIYESLNSLGCLPLASREIAVPGQRSYLPLVIFATAIAAAVFGLVRIDVAFVAAVVVLVATRLFPLREMYDSVEWPVIILLGAFLPVGAALNSTGATDLIADGITAIAGGMPLWVMLITIMTISALLSAVINNAATAVLMAPIAVSVANIAGVNFDPFLMAVAIGSSSAFLTPIGHQSNLLVMGPGGYRFGDYWRMGLPLTAVTFAVAAPLLVFFWGP